MALKSSAMTSVRLNMETVYAIVRLQLTIKQHARRFMAKTKTNILTAFDLKKVLERNGGAKGCRVSVVELPQSSSQIDTNARIPGISQFTISVTK